MATRLRPSSTIRPTRRLGSTSSRARLERLASSSDALVGSALVHPTTGDSYELIERLGAGSSAVTYRARRGDGADVAVKTLTLRGAGASAGASNGGFKAVELFERECRTLRALNHPNVPAYVDSFTLDTEDDRRYVLVQNLARGRNLRVKMEEDGWRPTEAEVRSMLKQLLDVARYCGSLRPPVIHRDVKPANVVMDDDGRVCLVDFGGAAAVIDSLDDSFGSTVVGTYGFMPPETVMSGAAATTASDMYGIGATILFLLSGRPPSGFKTERLRINFDDVFIEDRRLRLVVARLLEPSPEDRFRNAQEALDALDSTAVAPMGGRNFRSSRLTMDSPVSTMNSPRSTTEQLPAPYAPRGAPKPKNMVCDIVRVDGNSVSINIPPSGANGEVLYKAFFGVTWTGITAIWTVGVLSAGAWFMALFSLPFWKIGADLSSDVLRSLVAKGNVYVDRSNYRVACEGGGMKFLDAVGETADVEGCFVRPDGLLYLKLEDDTVVPILASVGRREAEYIASEINAHLEDAS